MQHVYILAIKSYKGELFKKLQKKNILGINLTKDVQDC